MKTVLLRALVAVLTATFVALTYPVFIGLGISDRIFVITSVIGGSFLIWVSLDMLESKAKIK